MKRLALTFSLCLLTSGAFAFNWGDPVAGKTAQGNQLLQQGRVPEAIAQYKAAQADAPQRPELDYDLGLALAKQGKLDEAIKSFQSAARAEGALKASDDFNLGWSYYQLGKKAKEANQLPQASEQLEKSVQSIHDALRLNPDDAQAKHNYEAAKQLLAQVKQMQQQQQKQDQQKNDQQKKQDQQKNQQQQKQQKQDQQQKDQQKQQGQQQNSAQSQPSKAQSQPASAPQATPTPTPAQTQPAQTQPAQPQQAQTQPAQSEPAQSQPANGELTAEQARRMLNQSGEENREKFRMLFVPDQAQPQHWARDW